MNKLLFLFFFICTLSFAQSQKKSTKPNATSLNCDLGSQKLAQKKYAEAIKEQDKCLTLEKDNFLAYIDRGKAKLELNKNEEALKDFTKALQLNKDYFQAAVLMAQANEKIKKYKEAM
ncbi:MAG: tetratricopeptide repeat protein [Bacteroidota bacterium]